MGKNQESSDGILEKLAIITDATQQIFPDGKSLLVFELNIDDFKKIQQNFREIDNVHKKFTVDISGVEVVFILENTIELNVKTKDPKTIWEKIKKKLFWKRSILTVKN